MTLLQRVEDGDCREAHHGQEAVAQHTGHTAIRHCQRTHQTQQNVHPNTGRRTDPIHITKVGFTGLNKEIRSHLLNRSTVHIQQ